MHVQSAAVFGRVAGDRAAGHLDAAGLGVIIDAAAVAVGRVAGDLSAARAQGAVVFDEYAAAVGDRMVIFDRGAADVDRGVGAVREHAAAAALVRAGAGGAVAGHRAADQINGDAAFPVRVVVPGVDAAAVFGRVAGDRAAVHRERAAPDGDTAAARKAAVAGERAAVQIDVRPVGADAAAFVAARPAADRACSFAVAQRQAGGLILRPGHGDGGQRFIGAGEGIAVQAQHQVLPRRHGQIGRHVARQIDGRLAVAIGDLARAVPRLKGHVAVRRVAARGDLVAADAVGMPQPQDQMDGRPFLDVIVGEGLVLFQLRAGKDQPLLCRGDALPLLDLGFEQKDRVRFFDVQCDLFPGQGTDDHLIDPVRRRERRQKGNRHAQDEQDAEDAFFHRFCPPFRRKIK